MEIKQEFKVEALTRFLYAPTGRIYDAGDVFSVPKESELNYLTKEHKLCKAANKESEITVTDQDKRDKAQEIELKRIDEAKAESLKVISEQAVKTNKKAKK